MSRPTTWSSLDAVRRRVGQMVFDSRPYRPGDRELIDAGKRAIAAVALSVSR